MFVPAHKEHLDSVPSEDLYGVVHLSVPASPSLLLWPSSPPEGLQSDERRSAKQHKREIELMEPYYEWQSIN